MTREQVLINHIQEYLDSGMWQYEACYLNKDDLKVIIKALEQEPCEDAISRDELLKAIDTWDKFGCDADTKLVPYQDHYIPYIHYDDVVKCIKGMPSVTLKPKTGHWIEEFNDLEGEVRFTCSSCGKYQLFGTDYCPNCGARMIEKQKVRNKE